MPLSPAGTTLETDPRRPAMPQEDVHLHYDEQIATETYVLRNYAHLLTDEERATLDGGLQAWWEENLERMHEWGAKLRFWKEPPPWLPALQPDRPDPRGRAVPLVPHQASIKIRTCVSKVRLPVRREGEGRQGAG